MKSILKLIGYLAYGLLLMAIPLLIVETAYRHQWIDFYRPELTSYNSKQTLENRSGLPTLMAMGDSFTAGRRSYPYFLQTAFSEYRVINAGISSTGVLEALTVAPDRFSVFRPKIWIYQIYIGNDLIDLGYHPDWSRFPLSRNLWWTFTNHFRSVPFIRARLGQWLSSRKAAETETSKASDSFGIDTTEEFSLSKYSGRVPFYYTLDPTVTEDSVLLKGVRKEDFQEYSMRLRELLRFCRPPGCRSFVVVVPHKAQLNEYYLKNEIKLGARISDPEALRQNEYPFMIELRKALADTGVIVVNPLPRLRKEDLREHVYFVNDDHLNERGQSILAQEIRGAIQGAIH